MKDMSEEIVPEKSDRMKSFTKTKPNFGTKTITDSEDQTNLFGLDDLHQSSSHLNITEASVSKNGTATLNGLDHFARVIA